MNANSGVGCHKFRVYIRMGCLPWIFFIETKIFFAPFVLESESVLFDWRLANHVNLRIEKIFASVSEC